MTQQELKHILSSKFDFEKWKDLLGMMFLKIDYLSKPIQIDADLVKSGGQVGTIRLDDGRSLGLFMFEVADNIQIARNRKGLRDIAIKYVDQDIIHGALVFYYSENHPDYRLTFISKQTSLDEDGSFETKTTAPKRYTFLLGTNEPCTTAANRLLELINKKKSGSVYLADVTEAFSVERLNKDFFKGYKEQYFKFLDLIGKESKENRDYVKKLLGRLVFLQFLQKKGWMGVPANHTNWEGGDKNYLYNLVKNYNGNDRLLSDVLEVLFFNTLNEKRTNDVANPILGDNIKIPYLNGGLFDKDDLDKKDIDFPYPYFEELIEFFGMYNFTIDENDPDDAEVGVDPEMLGHIFENLLEDNKDKGAFYTPKEIVRYMSEESIAQYLKTHTEEALHPAIDALIKEKKVDEAMQNKTTASAVYKLLCDVKVCDPAIGSGAFPMGVLNVLYHSRLLLYGFTKPIHEFSPANVKREIIQNNIYGVDIEQGAVDIARLRFWLALVVDETQPEPLPNLDFKIMQGNSLLEQFEGLNLADLLPKKNEDGLFLIFDEETQLQAILHEKQLRYFSTTDHEEKQTLRNEIVNVVKDLILERTQGNTSIPDKLKAIDLSANNQFFLWHTWFADVFEDGGFDVVIGNPPYISAPTQIANEQLAKQRTQIVASKQFRSLYQKWDLYIPFIELGTQLSRLNGITSMIVPFPLTNQLYAKVLRKMLVEEADLIELVDLNGTKIFENATVSNCIPFVCKSVTKGKTWISNIDEKLEIRRVFEQKHSNLVQDEKTFVWNVTRKRRETNRHADMNVLGDYCYISIGMVLNADEKTAKGEFTKDELISEMQNSIYCKKYVEAKNIERYAISKIRYLEFGTERVPAKIRRPTFPQLYDRPKMLTNKIGAMKVVVDYDNILCDQTNRICILWKDLHGIENKSIASSIKKYSTLKREDMEALSATMDLRYLLGVLNSRYANALLDTIRGIGNIDVNPEYIRNIPVPSATPVQQQPIISLVDQILSAKKQNPQADTSAWEEEIDELVYVLYGLTEDEIKVVEGK